MRRNAHVRFGGRPAETHPRKRGQGAAGRPYTYVRTMSGWVHVAFVTDVYSRRVIGRRTSTSPYTDLAAGALKMAVWARRREGADLTGTGPPLRPRGGVPGHPLRAGPGPVRGGRLGGLQGTPFGFALAGALILPVQGRAHPQPSPPR